MKLLDKLIPKLPQGIHPLRKLSLIIMFSIMGFALLQENLHPNYLEVWGFTLRVIQIGLAVILGILLIIVKKLESQAQSTKSSQEEKLKAYEQKVLSEDDP